MHKATPAKTVLRQIVLLPMGVTMALALILVIAQHRQNAAEARAGVLGTAHALAIAVDHQLLELRTALQVLASAASLSRGDFARFHERAATLHSTLGATNVVVLDLSGNQVVNTLRPWGAALPMLGEQAPLLPVIRQGVPMAKVVLAPLTGAPVVVIAVPVRIDGEMRYAVAASVPFKRFQALLDRQQLPAPWIGAVVDGTATIVARTTHPEQFAGKSAAPAVRQALTTGASGIFDGRTLEGIDVLTAFSKGPTFGWGVVIGIPQTELTHDLNRLLAWLAGGVAFVLMLCTALAWAQGRRAEGSLLRLVDAADRLGRGEPIDLPPMFLTEANRLAISLTNAGRDLAARHAEITSNEARWSAVLDSTTDGILSVNEQHQIVVYNRAAERIFGWRPDEALGQPLRVLLPACLCDTHREFLATIDETPESRTPSRKDFVILGLRNSGEEFPMEVSVSRIDTSKGRLHTVMVRDASERMRMEAEVARFARQAVDAREQEKARMARELHDELAQMLSLLKLQARSLAGRLGTDAQAQAKIAEIVSALDEGIAATRRIAADLRPMILDDLGLPAALRWLGENFTRRTGVACEVQAGDIGDVEEPYATAVFRIVQEALQNVAKHADASRASVRLWRDQGGLAVSIQDDGQGFDSTGVRQHDGLGMVGMRERAHLLNGTLHVETVPGQGTLVRAILPSASERPDIGSDADILGSTSGPAKP